MVNVASLPVPFFRGLGGRVVKVASLPVSFFRCLGGRVVKVASLPVQSLSFVAWVAEWLR